MQSDPKCTSCAKQVELMLLTREEDFKELNAKITEVHRLLDRKLHALGERITRLEQYLSN